MNFSIRCISCEKTICHIDSLPVKRVASLSYKGDIFPLHVKCHEKIQDSSFLRSLLDKIMKPERSKREDSPKCEMRCSEHCGNTVKEVQ